MDKYSFNFTGVIRNDIDIHECIEYDKLLKDNRGSKVIVSIKILGKNKTKENLGYYWGYVVKEVQKKLYDIGVIKSLRGVDDYLREQIIITSDTSYSLIGKKLSRIKRISELDNTELSEYLFQLKIWCSNELSLYIKDPDKD